MSQTIIAWLRSKDKKLNWLNYLYTGVSLLLMYHSVKIGLSSIGAAIRQGRVAFWPSTTRTSSKSLPEIMKQSINNYFY